MSDKHEIERALSEQLMRENPPLVPISNLAKLLQVEIPTIRARIRRGSFPIQIHKHPGGNQYVLLVDVIQYVTTGQTNYNNGVNRKPRGRPRKSEAFLQGGSR